VAGARTRPGQQQHRRERAQAMRGMRARACAISVVVMGRMRKMKERAQSAPRCVCVRTYVWVDVCVCHINKPCSNGSSMLSTRPCIDPCCTHSCKRHPLQGAEDEDFRPSQEEEDDAEEQPHKCLKQQQQQQQQRPRSDHNAIHQPNRCDQRPPLQFSRPVFSLDNKGGARPRSQQLHLHQHSVVANPAALDASKRVACPVGLKKGGTED